MKLTFFGGASEVGRSAILLETDKKLMLDYGIKLYGGTQYPALTDSLDLLVTSHAHLDHVGFAPALFNRMQVPWVATYPTQPIAGMLLIDSMKIDPNAGFDYVEFERLMASFFPLPYGNEFNLSKTSLSFHDAGHIPGSAMAELNHNGKKLVYSGDFNLTETKLHKGATIPKDVNALIIECTYGTRDHPARKETEKRLKQEIRETIDKDGTILLPCFAVGRTQEIIQVLDSLDLDVEIYLEGMGARVTNAILDYPSYIKDAKMLKKAFDRVHVVQTASKRKKAISEPGIVVASGGMLEGGPAIRYLLSLNRKNPNSKVIFTGYGVENTNAWYLLRKGFVKRNNEEIKIDLDVNYLDFSAHAGRSDILRFIKESNAEKIFCVHGDSCDQFVSELREMGYDATAPKINDTYLL